MLYWGCLDYDDDQRFDRRRHTEPAEQSGQQDEHDGNDSSELGGQLEVGPTERLDDVGRDLQRECNSILEDC